MINYKSYLCKEVIEAKFRLGDFFTKAQIVQLK